MTKKAITFYSLRHAETTYNESKLFTGWHDPLLSNKGIQQASILNLTSYNYIISSQHSRCKHTLEKAGVDSSFDIDCRLNEICLGELEGLPINNIEGYKNSPLDYAPPKGESYRLAYYRILSLLFELYYRIQLKADLKCLLCTSSGIIRIIKALEYKPLIQDFHNIKTDNCTITKHTLDIDDFYYLSKL